MKPSLFCLALFIIFCSSSNLVTSQDSCSINVDDWGLKFDTSSLRCVLVWEAHKFILRYEVASPNSSHFVLTFPTDINAYVAIGFSKDGRMVGSSAVVAWIAGNELSFKSYYLGGTTQNQVTLDGEHSFKGPVGSSSSTFAWIAFKWQVKPSPHLIFAVGPQNSFPSGSNFVLSQHVDTYSLLIDYETG